MENRLKINTHLTDSLYKPLLFLILTEQVRPFSAGPYAFPATAIDHKLLAQRLNNRRSFAASGAEGA